MITIRPVYNEFKITFSNPGSGWRGYSVMARNLDEVHMAIDHYHRMSTLVKVEHQGKNEKCPLCRLEMEEARKRGRK
jgi:hypothetical protein